MVFNRALAKRHGGSINACCADHAAWDSGHSGCRDEVHFGRCYGVIRTPSLSNGPQPTSDAHKSKTNMTTPTTLSTPEHRTAEFFYSAPQKALFFQNECLSTLSTGCKLIMSVQRFTFCLSLRMMRPQPDLRNIHIIFCFRRDPSPERPDLYQQKPETIAAPRFDRFDCGRTQQNRFVYK